MYVEKHSNYKNYNIDSNQFERKIDFHDTLEKIAKKSYETNIIILIFIQIKKSIRTIVIIDRGAVFTLLRYFQIRYLLFFLNPCCRCLHIENGIEQIF